MFPAHRDETLGPTTDRTLGAHISAVPSVTSAFISPQCTTLNKILKADSERPRQGGAQRSYLRSERNLPKKASGGRNFFDLDLEFRPKRTGSWGVFRQTDEDIFGISATFGQGQGVPAATPRPKPAWHMVRRLKGLYLWVLTAGDRGSPGGRVRLGRREAGEEWACRVGVDIVRVGGGVPGKNFGGERSGGSLFRQPNEAILRNSATDAAPAFVRYERWVRRVSGAYPGVFREAPHKQN